VCLSVCPSVCLSVCRSQAGTTKTDRITPRTPYDRPGTLVFWCQRYRRNSNDVNANIICAISTDLSEPNYPKPPQTPATDRVTLYCTLRMSALTTRPHGQVLVTVIGHHFIKLTVDIRGQHSLRESMRRAGLSAAAETCFEKKVKSCNCILDTRLTAIFCR